MRENFHEISLIKQEGEDRKSKLKIKFFRLFSRIISGKSPLSLDFGARYLWIALTAVFSRYFTYKTGSGRQNIKTKNLILQVVFFDNFREITTVTGFSPKFIWIALH